MGVVGVGAQLQFCHLGDMGAAMTVLCTWGKGREPRSCGSQPWVPKVLAVVPAGHTLLPSLTLAAFCERKGNLEDKDTAARPASWGSGYCLQDQHRPLPSLPPPRTEPRPD